ncbi:hypothetical protein LPC_2379 [Legionella pneumophila str. Corby]|nr:hypothetical protein LPC_2379 [Legionella pneumophila str. Corby]
MKQKEEPRVFLIEKAGGKTLKMEILSKRVSCFIRLEILSFD